MADITINLRADPAQFEAGTKAAEAALEEWENSSGDSADVVAKKLEEVIRTLVKLGTASGKTGDEMRSDLRKFGLSAEQAEDAVEAVWKEIGKGDDAARGIDKAADALADVEKKADDAADATSKVGDASKKAGADVSDLGSIARDVLEGDFGGAAESAIGALSSIGLFAGAGGALGTMIGQGVVSIGTMFVEQWTKTAEATKARIASMYEDMTASGEAFLSEAFVAAEAHDIISEKGERYEKAMQLSRDANIGLGLAIKAVAGSAEAQAEIQEKLGGIVDANSEKAAGASTEWLKTQQELNGLDGATKRALETMEGLTGEFGEAQGSAALYRDTMNSAGAESETAAGKIDGVSLALKSLPPGKTIVIDADTSAYFAQVEAIRRQKLSKTVEFDYVINERRGTQVQ